MPKGIGYSTTKGTGNKKTGKHTVTHVNKVPVSGGGGMHQMGAAQKTKKPSLKKKVMKYLSTPTPASKAVNKAAKKIARKSLGIKMKKGRE